MERIKDANAPTPAPAPKAAPAPVESADVADEIAQNIDRLGTNGAFMADPAILRGDAAVDVPAPGAESDNMFIWLN